MPDPFDTPFAWDVMMVVGCLAQWCYGILAGYCLVNAAIALVEQRRYGRVRVVHDPEALHRELAAMELIGAQTAQEAMLEEMERLVQETK